MAITLSRVYGSGATAPDTDYPGGTFKDKDGINPGTPLQHTWARDKDGFFQAVLKNAGITPLETADTALSSQYLQAMSYLFNRTTKMPRLDLSQVCEAKFYGIYDWSRPDAMPNLSPTESKIYRDACVGIDYSTGLPCLYVVTDDDEIRRASGPLRYDGTPALGSALSLEFSAGPPESIRSVCCDGEHLYVLWRKASDGYHVAKFYMASVGGYVPVGDMALDFDYSTDPEYSKIIVASSYYLAVSSDNIAGNCGVAIVPKGSGGILKG